MDTNNHENNRLWYLLARKTANEITDSESEELLKLLQEKPEALYAQEVLNQQWHDGYKRFTQTDINNAFERHKLRLENAETDVNEEVLYVKGTESDINEKANGSRKLMFLRYASIAAAAVLVLLLLFKWNGAKKALPNPEEEIQQLATQYGSRSQLILPDGTKVWLNGGSKLDYPKQFSGSLREVTLEGEAFFDVTENKHHPFLVHTKTFTVKVLGTAFNIRAYNDEDSATASLIRGSVEVELHARKNNKVLLRPSEKLVVPAVAVLSAPEETSDNADLIPAEVDVKKTPITTDITNTIAETAWVDNKLVFKNKSFEQIALVLEKWFAVEIRFKNENRKKLNLSGTFDGENLDEILRAFMETGSSAFSYKKDAAGAISIY